MDWVFSLGVLGYLLQGCKIEVQYFKLAGLVASGSRFGGFEDHGWFFVDLMFKFGLEDALCFGFGRLGFGALGFAVEAWGLDFGN